MRIIPIIVMVGLFALTTACSNMSPSQPQQNMVGDGTSLGTMTPDSFSGRTHNRD
ncbi:MAG: hypothetical protein WCF85_19320 [Rhodospirillaceae bacterium]